jgi:tetratricopeptide (TPR) repeat protein
LALLPVEEWIEDEETELIPTDLLDEMTNPTAGNILFRVGIQDDAGRPTMTVPPFWNALLHVLRVHEGVDSAETIADARPVPVQVSTEKADDTAGTTCPYLRQQAARPEQPAPELTGDALDNLRKLDEGRKLLRQADFFRRVGHPDAARFYYCLVQRLCPGSRYAEVATAQLSRLPAGAAEAGSEEQEQGRTEPFTCPYLLQEAARQQPAPSGSQAPGSVLENLEKLEHAAEVYRRAESYRRRGRVEEARGCYQSIRDLCPGSHLAGLANDRLKHLPTGETKSAGEAASEEEEVPPPAPKEKKPEKHSSARSVGSRVSGLLERCQRAVAAGRYAEAETLARRAIALDPDTVAASPLVYKLHLLRQLRDGLAAMVPPPDYSHWSGGFFENLNEITATPGAMEKWKRCQIAALMQRYFECFKEGLYPEAEMYALQALELDPQNSALAAAARLAVAQRLTHPPASEPAVCPWAAEPRTTMRQPDLPPVDPGILSAMEKVLTEVGEPGADKVTVTVEEQGADEEPEEQPASSEEVPTLLLDPPGDDRADHAAKNLTLQDLLDTLRSAACVEVGNTPFCGRGQCQVPVGMISARLAWDCRDEHGSFVLSLVFGETPDLRANQWEHNDRVADWIATHGGSAVPPASKRDDTDESEEAWRP